MSTVDKIENAEFSVELIRAPRKYNRSIRISGVQAITPDILKAVVDVSSIKAKEESNPNLKSDWEHIKSSAQRVIENNLCPEQGVAVLGPFILASVRFPEKGDQVVVKKGAYTRSTHPDEAQAEKTLTRNQTVVVHQVYGGYIDVDKTITVKDPEVHWAGTGGYWRWVSLADVAQ